jgi:phthalate 4,5-dioxygenase reductase subunit
VLPVSREDMLQVRVVRAEPAALGIQLFEFEGMDGADLPEFTPGSHISVQVPNGELRKYSLCNEPGERHHYLIAVKREDAGRGGSVSLIDNVTAGDTVLISPPRNDFELKPNRAGYVFIAGGIGITPILSMVRHLKATAGPKFRLYYLTLSPEVTAFARELSAPEFRGQVRIHHDGGEPARSFDLWPVLEQPKGAHLYCCGPRSLMQAVRDMTGHWSSAAVHFESFSDGSDTHRTDDRPFTVKLARSNATIEIPADKSILETLRNAGYRVASSCESGTCGTCKTGLLAGEPDHRDLVLAEFEKQSHVMICVSRARSGELTLDL